MKAKLSVISRQCSVVAAAIVLLACSVFAVDVIMGRSGQLTFSGSGTDLIGSFGTNAAPPAAVTNAALQFDGVQNLVEQTGTSILPLSEISIMVWAEYDENLSEHRPLVRQSNGDGGDLTDLGFVFDIRPWVEMVWDEELEEWVEGDTKMGLRMTFTDGQSVIEPEITAAIEAGTNHIAVTYNGANITFYVNGAENYAGEATGIISNTVTETLRLGVVGGASFGGQLAGIAIWNRALSASDVLACKTNKAVPSGLTNGLVLWWKMNEAAGTNLWDSSGNGRHGVLIGDPLPTWTILEKP